MRLEREAWLLQDFLLRAAERHPAKCVLVAGGERYSYERLLHDAAALARALRGRGLQPGDRVLIYMDNTWPCVVSIFGALLAGAVFLVVNPQTKADKLRFILRDSGAAALLSDAHLAKVLLPALEDRDQSEEGQPSIRACSGRPLQGFLPFDALLEEGAGRESASPGPLPDPGRIPLDLASLIYTSGSTGSPKGVMMSHQSMVFAAEAISRYLRLGPEERILNALPLAFDYGLYQLLMTVRLGATLVLERSFTYPAQVLKILEEEEATVFPGVPTVYAMLLSLHARKRLCFPSIRRITNTAAALPKDFLRDLAEIFPNALIFKMYGLTECKRVAYLEPEDLERKPDSVGKAIPGTQAFVLNEEGKPVAPGEVGVLHVRGPHVMLGYWGREDLSREMLREGPLPGERMLCAKDLFRVDEECFLYFVGRDDDIIKTRGEKVSPIEVENCLHGMPGIREAAVLGVPDAILGQAILAFVVCEPGAELSDKDIKKHCLARLENFMVPKEVVFRDSLPKTTTGKIRKKGLLDDEDGTA
jgi:acyl-CoA synthetase (AMP-forming)/AMP-acid ligase II